MTAAPSKQRVHDQVDPLTHQALCYRDSDDYLAATVPVIGDQLADGLPVAIAVPGPQLDLLRAELGETGDLVRWIDITREGRNPGRIIPSVLCRFADAHPEQRVLVVIETTWPGRTELEYPACVQHEAVLNLAFASRDATVLCLYDAAALSDEILADAAATHPFVIGNDVTHLAGARYAPDRAYDRYNLRLPESAGAQPHTVTLAEVSATRQAVAAYAERAGLTPSQAEDVQLVVSELLVNAIRHGDGTAGLLWWTDAGGPVYQVSGTGRIIDPLAGRLPAGPTRRNGRGLLLINHFADLIRTYTSPSGTVTRAYFHRA
jgi:hypothetical protein